MTHLEQSAPGSTFPNGQNVHTEWETLRGSPVVLWCVHPASFLPQCIGCPGCPANSVCSPYALFLKDFMMGRIQPIRKESES